MFSLGKLHDFAVQNEVDEAIVGRGALNTQLEIITAQTCTERTRQEQELRDSDRLPTKKEMKRLAKGVEVELKKFADKPSKSFTYAEYLQYCKYVIVRIVVYNLRRSGEVAAMSLKQFDERTKGKVEWLCLSVKQREMACHLAVLFF